MAKNESIATLAANIKKGVDNRLKELHTSIPGIVESFDAAKQTATVQPAVRRVFVSREGDTEILVPENLPLLINVPVQFPRGGGFSLTFPVKQGDECLIVFCERSYDNWHRRGGVRDPGARRFHSLSDATAFVGISSLPNKVPNYSGTDTQLKKDDGSVSFTIGADSTLKLDADANVTVSSGANISAEATGEVNVSAGTVASITAPVINLNGAVNISGAVAMAAGAAVTGAMTNNGVDIGGTHRHPQEPDSDGNIQQNTGTPI